MRAEHGRQGELRVAGDRSCPDTRDHAGGPLGPAGAATLMAMLAAAAGCNAIWGLGDLSYGPGGSGGATSTAHGGGGTGATGGGNGEQCLDGVDNDGDGLTDCGDVGDCAVDYECVAALPGAEYVLLVDPASACPTGTEPSTAYACTGCQCLITAVPCTVTLTAFSDASCSDTPATYTASGDCQAGSGSTQWMTLTSSMSTPPTCAPADTHAPAVQWKACLLAQPGLCPNGQACVPRGPGPLSPCAHVGDTDVCPSDLPIALVTYGDEGLQCTCSCTAGAAQCGSASVAVWHNSPDCSGGSTTQIVGEGGCQSAGVSGSLQFNIETATMSCPESAEDAPAGPGTKLCCPA